MCLGGSQAHAELRGNFAVVHSFHQQLEHLSFSRSQCVTGGDTPSKIVTSKFKVATPANWKDGEDCIITPAVNNDEAKTLFPKGFKIVKPYLRYTPQPNK